MSVGRKSSPSRRNSGVPRLSNVASGQECRPGRRFHRSGLKPPGATRFHTFRQSQILRNEFAPVVTRRYRISTELKSHSHEAIRFLRWTVVGRHLKIVSCTRRRPKRGTATRVNGHIHSHRIATYRTKNDSIIQISQVTFFTTFHFTPRSLRGTMCLVPLPPSSPCFVSRRIPLRNRET